MSLLSALLPLALAVLPCRDSTLQQKDSAAFAKLDTMLENYCSAIERESVSLKEGECDFLIGSVGDSLLSRHIALSLYDRYKDSPVMGDEAVAIHIYDNWFKPGKIAMRSEFDRLEADIFATFNRSTLIGMKAPSAVMKSPCGKSVTMPQDDGRHSILFFFDTGCGKCRLEAELMPQVLDKISFPTTFYAVYCGSDKKAWRKFRRDFRTRNRNVRILHLWDPEITSDYLRLYGVTSTPRLLITDTDGEILGRRLEIESLEEMIFYIGDYYGQAKNN